MSLRGSGTALFVLIAALLAIGVTGCGEGGKIVAAPGRPAAPPNALASRFAVFARPHTRGDVIPPSVLPRGIAAELHLDLRGARRARLYRDQPVFVASSPKLTCTFSRRHEVGNCWPTAIVSEGLASAASICGLGGGSRTIVYGLLPDGAETVTVPSPGRGSQTVPVIGNVFIASVSSTPPLPQRLSFSQNGMRIVGPTGIPPDVARNGCGNGIPVPHRNR